MERILDDTIYIVSGLPRSGTSMMMLMLKEGGIEPYYSPERTPNEANPNGFFETYDIDLLLNNNIEWLEKVKGKAVKIAFNFIDNLPNIYKYKVIVMRRNIDEIIQSRRKVFAMNGNYEYAEEAEGYLLYIHNQLLDKGYSFLYSNKAEYIDINYNLLMDNPENELKKVYKFIPFLDLEKMLNVPDQKLYRNRMV